MLRSALPAAAQPRWHARGSVRPSSVAGRAGRFRSVSSSSESSSSSTSELAERLQLLQRLLAVAVREEDYSRAAALRDQRASLLSSLPLEQQLVQTALDELRSGLTPSRRAAAAHTLAACGDPQLAPLLSAALHDVHEEVHGAVEEALWALWLRSGDQQTDALMQRGAASLRAAAVVGADALRDALAAFEAVTVRQPSFAEGWNKRATCLFLLKDYEASLRDCKRVVKSNQQHFGAWSGAAMCALNLGDESAAKTYFATALAINPRLQAALRYLQVLDARMQERRREEGELEDGEDGEGGTDLRL